MRMWMYSTVDGQGSGKSAAFMQNFMHDLTKL